MTDNKAFIPLILGGVPLVGLLLYLAWNPIMENGPLLLVLITLVGTGAFYYYGIPAGQKSLAAHTARWQEIDELGLKCRPWLIDGRLHEGHIDGHAVTLEVGTSDFPDYTLFVSAPRGVRFRFTQCEESGACAAALARLLTRTIVTKAWVHIAPFSGARLVQRGLFPGGRRARLTLFPGEYHTIRSIQESIPGEQLKIRLEPENGVIPPDVPAIIHDAIALIKALPSVSPETHAGNPPAASRNSSDR